MANEVSGEIDNRNTSVVACVSEALQLLDEGEAFPLSKWKTQHPDGFHRILTDTLAQARDFFGHDEARWLEWLKKLRDGSPDFVDQVNRLVGELYRNPRYNRERSLPALRVGPYHLTKWFDSGGEAELYLAYRDDNLRWYAVKFYRARTEGGAQETREALAVAPHADRLEKLMKLIPHHPHIVRFVDRIRHEVGDCFVSEYVKSQNLEKYAQNHKFEPGDLVRWMRGLCAAVSTLHDEDCVHRDLKPRNVLIASDSKRSLLTDFGLSLVIAAGADESRAAAAGVGTIAYMAPEVARARVDPSTPVPRNYVAVDVFGLGAILYFLLTRTSPYSPSDTIEVVSKGAFNDSALGLATVDQELVAICRRAMSVDPRERYRSASEMDAALRGTRQARTNRLDAHVWRDLGEESPRWSRWMKGVVGALAVALLMLAAESALLVRVVWLETPGASNVIFDSEWQTIAADQGIDLSRLSASDFDVDTVFEDRTTPAWELDEGQLPTFGRIRIRVRPELQDLLPGVRVRVADRPWKWISIQDNPTEALADLDRRDLDLDGPVHLCIGGGDALDGPIVAGPIPYEISLKGQLRASGKQLLADRIADAAVATPFDMTRHEWAIAPQFESRHSTVLREMRFGPAPDRLERSAAANEREKREFPSAYPIGYRLPLRDVFEHSKGDYDRHQTLCVQLHFVDGSTSPIKSYTLVNRFGHDGELASAKKLLAELPSDVPIARFRGSRFLLDGMARVGGSLQRLEFAEPQGEVLQDPADGYAAVGGPLSFAVVPAAPLLAPIEGGDSDVQRHLEEQLLEGEWTAEAGVVGGMMEQPIALPPHWTEAVFQGVFVDGTKTRRYTVVNEEPEHAFEAQPSIKSPRVRLYVSVAAPDLRPPNDNWNNPSPLMRVVASPAAGVTRTRLFRDDEEISRLYDFNFTWAPNDLPGRVRAEMQFAGEPLDEKLGFWIDEAQYYDAMRRACADIPAEVLPRMVQLIQFEPKVLPTGERPLGRDLSEKTVFYKKARSVIGDDPQSSGTVLAGVPYGPLWGGDWTIEYRVPGGEPRKHDASWRVSQASLSAQLWVYLPPVFAITLPGEPPEVEMTLRSSSGRVLGPFVVESERQR